MNAKMIKEIEKTRQRHVAVTSGLPTLMTKLDASGAVDVVRQGAQSFDPDYQFILSTTGYLRAAIEAIDAGKVSAYALTDTGMGAYSLEVEVSEGRSDVSRVYNSACRRLKAAQAI